MEVVGGSVSRDLSININADTTLEKPCVYSKIKVNAQCEGGGDIQNDGCIAEPFCRICSGSDSFLSALGLFHVVLSTLCPAACLYCH